MRVYNFCWEKRKKGNEKKKPLFTLGSVYSTSASRAEQTTETQIFQIERNIVKNPNWPEANQLAIYKRCRGFELRATEKEIQVVVTAELEPGTAGFRRVRHADHSATAILQSCNFWLSPSNVNSNEWRLVQSSIARVIKVKLDDCEARQSYNHLYQTEGTVFCFEIQTWVIPSSIKGNPLKCTPANLL